MKLIFMLLLMGGVAFASMSTPIRSFKNQTTTLLSDGATYTGTWEDCETFSNMKVAVLTDADGLLYIQQSNDRVTTHSSLSYNVTANINEVHSLEVTRKWCRLVFTDDSDGVAQTSFDLSLMLGHGGKLTAPQNLSISPDADATVVRPTIPYDEGLIGRRSGMNPFTKFSYRTGLTAAGGEETVWATTGNFTPMTTASTFTITYNNATDGLGTTGALTLYFQYIDSNGLKQVANHTLSNTGSDVTSFSGLGINRVAVSSSGTAQKNTSAITITETTGATTQATIPAGASVTQQAIFHVDSNSYGVLKEIYLQTAKLGGGSNPKVLIKMYVFNRNVATRYELFRTTIDTSSETNVILTKPVGIRLTPTDVIYWVADTDTNSTDISVRFSLVEYKIN